MVISKNINRLEIVIFLVLFSLGLQSCKTPYINDTNIFSNKISTKPYKVGKNWYQPILKTEGFQQKGIASWYGEKFHGKRTANGSTFNMYTITAAHKTLPFHCWVRVINLRNNKSINVKITDRGPFTENRIIDLSYAAAEKIDIITQGTTYVRIIYLGKRHITNQGKLYIQPMYNNSPFAIQIGAFSKIKMAEKIKNQLLLIPYKTSITPSYHNQDTIYRVLMSGFPSFRSAIKYKQLLEKKGFNKTLLLSEQE